MKVLPPPILLLIAIILMIAIWFLWAQPVLVPPPWHWLGLLLIALGLPLSVGSAMYFRRIGTNIIPHREPGQLVSDRAFGYTRNPMYLGLSLILLGLAIIFSVPTSFVIVAAFVFIIDRSNIRFEEAAMERKFGDAYREYKTRVRRWL